MAIATSLSGPERRRRWPAAERARILSAASAPGAVVTQVARENAISTGLIYKPSAIRFAGVGPWRASRRW
jgi:transposase-like protein